MVLPFTLGLMGPQRASAQDPCPNPAWHPFDPSTSGYPGANGPVFSTTLWDPDGPGPLAQRLVVGGRYRLIGDTMANSIATLDLATHQWSPLGAGVFGPGDVGDVEALTTLPNDWGGEDLIAGGEFYWAGGQQIIRLARWDGQTWSPIGGGVEYPSLEALATLPDGAGGTDLIVGGSFEVLGGVTVNSIARWDGIAFHPMGQGLNGPVYALLSIPGDIGSDLIAGGSFTTAGGAPAASIARWDGAGWHALEDGIPGMVASLATMPSGSGGLDLIAGGFFTQAGGSPASSIARWNGSAWAPLGDGITSGGGVYSLAAFPNGIGGVDLIAGGSFIEAGGAEAKAIARWNGSTWSPLGTGMPGQATVRTLAIVPDQAGGVELCAGGTFGTAGGVPAASLARWDGAAWSGINGGMLGGVYDMVKLPNDTGGEDFIIGGLFQGLGGMEAKSIARWDGASWSALGSGIDGEGGVFALAALPDDAGHVDLIAGGWFTQMGGVAAARIARWNGTAWAALGSGMNDSVYAMTTLPDGAGGVDLIAGGNFSEAGGEWAGCIARWNGTAWSPVGAGMSSSNIPGVFALTTIPGESGRMDLIAGGRFNLAGNVPANAIARWDGTQWHPLGSGMEGANFWPSVGALATMPSDAGGVDLYAGGYFYKAGGVWASNVARWDGTQWFALGDGVGWGPKFPSVGALMTFQRASGGFDLIVGGNFMSPGSRIARWDGGGWSALGSGLTYPTEYQSVQALAWLPRVGGGADLIAGGSFFAAGGVIAPALARFGCVPTPCPADCDGSATLNINDFICFQTLFVLGC